MNLRRRFVFTLGVAVVALTATAATPHDSGVVRGADQFEFTYRVKLPAIAGAGRLWVPLAKSGPYQKVEVKEIIAPIRWRELHDRDYGNSILLLSPGPDESGKIVEVRYGVNRLEKSSYAATDADPTRFLRPERLVPAHKTFQTLAMEAARGKKGDLERGRALYDHVLQRMRYDKSSAGWGRGDAVRACSAHAGNCSDFHAYFIALARAAGIPARFAVGATIPADKKEGTIGGYHCWAEFLAADRWIPVDLSEASKHPELADYYFGHHPANRFEFSAGRDLVVEPGPVEGPINFLADPVLEVDGKRVKTKTEFSFRRGRDPHGS